MVHPPCRNGLQNYFEILKVLLRPPYDFHQCINLKLIAYQTVKKISVEWGYKNEDDFACVEKICAKNEQNILICILFVIVSVFNYI